MQKCKLTLSETYKPLTPVMVIISGKLVGLTVKTCPKKNSELLLKDAEASSVGHVQNAEERNALRLQF